MSYEQTATSHIAPFLKAAQNDDLNAAENIFSAMIPDPKDRKAVGSTLSKVARIMTGTDYQIDVSPDTLLKDIKAKSPVACRAIENAARKLAL